MKQVLTIAIATLVVMAAACSPSSEGGAARHEGEVFGDGTSDPSPVIATVNGEEITQHMLDLRLEELKKDSRKRFETDEGKRMLLREMVAEMLRVREAERRELDNDPVVARVLIAERRNSMDKALRAELLENNEPSPDDIRAYYLDHRDEFKKLGTMHASHVEVATEEEAQKAYRELVEDKRPLGYVVHDYSINEQTRATEGELGWFNKGGFIPYVPDSKAFTEKIWDLEPGVNPPVKVGDRWHVVKIHERRYERNQTLEEAYDQVVKAMLPEFQYGIIENWDEQALAAAQIEYLGDYRPGKGRTAQELLERALYVKDYQQKMDLLNLLVFDYPDDPLVDDALFVAGNLALDTYGDKVSATRYLEHLVERFPDSEYAQDAQYIIENMYRPGFTNPRTIEDLRK